MAIKDLALFKLAGSVLKKAKDKIVGGSAKKLQESVTSQKDESVQETFRAMVGKTKEQEVSEVGVDKDLKTKTEEKEVSRASVKSETLEKVTTKSTKIAKEKTTLKSETKKTKKPASKKSAPKKVAEKEVTSTAKKSITPKATTAKKESTKATTKKADSGTKREAKIKLYTKDVKKHYGSVDDLFLAIIVKNLGPSIYRKDAELVSCADSKELETVRKNFLIKKLGFDKSENEMLDGEIKKVCESMKGTRAKYRATFYYILAKNLKKESALS